MFYRIEIMSDEYSKGVNVGSHVNSFRIDSELPLPVSALRTAARHACRHLRLPYATLVETDDAGIRSLFKGGSWLSLYSWLTD